MNLGSLTVSVSNEVTAKFKERAKGCFPNETFAYLVGQYVDKDRVSITDIHVPENVDAFCNPAEVDVQGSWLRKARAAARRDGNVLVGDIHSHPYSAKEMAGRAPHKPDTSPSESDLERTFVAGPVMGICLVTESSTGKLRARVRFWAPMVRIIEVVSR